MKKILIALICLPLFSMGQSDANKGVRFEMGISWEQVKQKAKRENKYIFVDCYTTWCAPCKVMEKNVYPEEKVGEVVNAKFISIKVQMDKTDKDGDLVKSGYKDAMEFEKEYNISAYPTLLFFSSDGVLVHRVSQGLNVEGFLELVSTALDPRKRYHAKLAEYKNGNTNSSFLKDLLISAKAANDRKTSGEIAERLISRFEVKDLFLKENREIIKEFGSGLKAQELASKYIQVLTPNQIYLVDNLFFIHKFTKTSTDKGFKIFYNNSKKVNKVINSIPLPQGAVRQTSDFAGDAIRSIIYKENVSPILKFAADSLKSLDPNWQEIKEALSKKYQKADVERIVVDAKVNWYHHKKNWPEYSKSLLIQMDMKFNVQNLRGETFAINNYCWYLFERATDIIMLNKAIGWMEEVFRQNQKDTAWATAIDTYANLLYKVGRKQEAIVWEEKALKSNPSERGVKEVLEKMKKGIPTWPQN